MSSACSIESCARPSKARSYCDMHYQRWGSHGDPLVVLPLAGRPVQGDFPRYASIHKRLSRARGPARKLACVDCRGAAATWSYDNADPDAVSDMVKGTLIAYSLDMSHYEPRCVSCHRKFDRAADKRSRNALGQFEGNPVGVHVAVSEA